MNKDMHQIFENYRAVSANQEIINEGLVSRIGSRVAGVGSALTGGGYQAGKINSYKATANKKINALTRELATDLQKLGINVDVAKLSNQMASQINNQMDGMVNSILTGSNQSTVTSGSSVTPAVQSSTSSTPEVTPNATAAATASNPQQQGSKAGQLIRRAGQLAGDTVGNFGGGLIGGVEAGYKHATANMPKKPASQGIPPVLPNKKEKPGKNKENLKETFHVQNGETVLMSKTALPQTGDYLPAGTPAWVYYMARKATPEQIKALMGNIHSRVPGGLSSYKDDSMLPRDLRGVEEDEDCETNVKGVKTRMGLQPQVKPSKFFP